MSRCPWLARSRVTPTSRQAEPTSSSTGPATSTSSSCLKQNGPFPYHAEIWDRNKVVDGSVTLSGSGSAPGCTFVIPAATYPLGTTPPEMGETFFAVGPGDPEHYQMTIKFPSLPFDQQPEAIVTCPGEDPEVRTVTYPMDGLSLVYTPEVEETEEGQPGIYNGTSSFNGANYEWSLTGHTPSP